MTTPTIDRRTYLATAGSAAVAGLAGCLGGGSTGTLATHVTDQPGDIADFESCVVTIVGIWLGPQGTEADDETSNERQYLEFDEPQEADLVELQGDNTALIDERDIETGTYAFLQLDVDTVDATLDGGGSATVQVPGDAPLTFNKSFEVREDTRTVFTADFTPVKQGQAGGYILQPVPQGITVEYEE